MSLHRKKVVAHDREHLRNLVYESIEKYGPNCDLNFINVFYVNVFNGNISGWNLSDDNEIDNLSF